MLIVVPCGGLGNRLMAMLSARLLAEHLGCPFRICWREQDWLPFSRFELADIISGLDAECWSGPEPEAAYRHEHHTPGPVPEVEARLRAGMTVWLESYCFIKPAGLGQAAFVEALHRQFRGLQPRTEVLARVPVLSPGAVGVQIRRTDHWCATRYSPLRLFFKVMDGRVAEVPTTSYYLATDDPAVKRVMKKRYGSRLITAPDVVAPTPAETAQAALADMLALSRTSIIYHSVMSSFGFVAHHWTHCPLRCVSTPGMPTQWQGSPVDRQFGQLIEWSWEAMGWRPQGHVKNSFRLRWTARLYLVWSRLVRSRLYQHWPFHVLTVR